MTSTATAWHVRRRRRILSNHPEIAALPRHNPRALFPIILTPAIHFGFAYLSQYLGIAGVALLAWTAGSLCNFAMFNYSHELSHNLVHPKIRGRLQDALLHYASVLSLSPSTYILFKFGHKPHHTRLGLGSVASAQRFLTEKHPDVELLIDRYYFELVHEPGQDPRSLVPSVFKNRFLRMLSVGFVFPITSAFKGAILSPLVLLFRGFKNFFAKSDGPLSQRINAIVIHLVPLYVLVALLYVLAGPLALLYLALAEVSQRGFLFHPIVIFPMSSHKTWGDADEFQPTTSTYGWVSSKVLMNLNYHVEHHDFPEIPCRYLPEIKRMAPEFYNSLSSFGGIFAVIKHYFRTEHWIYAGGFASQEKGAPT